MVLAVDEQRPIRATYKSTTYRSRLEARWAMFFDLLGVPIAYEAEGFQLKSGWYLADFLLPQCDTWLEIKPDLPSELERQKCRDLCAATAKRVILAYGPFGSWLPERSQHWMQSSLCFSPSMDPDGAVVCYGEDTDYEPCVCPVCGTFGFEFEGRGARICRGKKDCCGDLDRGHTSDEPRVRAAAEKALVWSFWR